jgi:HSP20 family protein
MVMRHWDPFNEFRQMQGRMNRLLRGFGASAEGEDMETWSVPLDVMQQGDNFVVHASMPGVKPDEIKVTIEDNVLTIRGQTASEFERQEGNYLMRERRSGSFHRALRLPDTVDIDQAQTSHDNGVLTITIPKAESKKARELKVSAGAQALEGQRQGDGQREATERR